MTISTTVTTLGSFASTQITGTIKVRNGINSDCIKVCAAPLKGEVCCWTLDWVFPPCDSEGPCNVIWYEPQIECAYTQGGYTYYNFTTSATNYSNTLYNLTWHPCSSPDVTISTTVTTLGGFASTQITGTIIVRNGINSDCIKVCADLVWGEACCWTLDWVFPECDSDTGGEENELYRVESAEITTKPQLSVAPNPASNLLRVAYELEAYGAIELKLISTDGRVVRHISGMNRQAELPMDLSNLQGGLYLLALFRDGQMVAQQKVAVLKGN